MRKSFQTASPMMYYITVLHVQADSPSILWVTCLPCSESEGADEKPMGAAKLRGHSSLEAHTGSESESSSLTRVPSSPFEAAQVSLSFQAFLSDILSPQAPQHLLAGHTVPRLYASWDVHMLPSLLLSCAELSGIAANNGQPVHIV